MAQKIRYCEKWYTSHSVEELLIVFQENVETVEEFNLLSKLSAGGVVVRVLQGPQTELPFWGRCKDNTVKMVQNLPSVNISAYQPIVYLDMQTEEKGTSISVRLEPHPQADVLAVAEWVGAVLCTTAGLIGMQANSLAVLGVILGVLLVVFPRLRAKWSFEHEVQRCLTALQQLPLNIAKTEKIG